MIFEFIIMSIKTFYVNTVFSHFFFFQTFSGCDTHRTARPTRRARVRFGRVFRTTGLAGDKICAAQSRVY